MNWAILWAKQCASDVKIKLWMILAMIANKETEWNVICDVVLPKVGLSRPLNFTLEDYYTV